MDHIDIERRTPPGRRKSGLLPTIDFYVFKEFMVVWSACVLAFLILFLVGDLLNDLQDFIENSAPPSKAALYFLLKMPGNIRFVLPVSLLLACMYTMARFGMNNEITAMRASGISLIRCGMPIYAVAFLMTGLNFWFNEALVPDCEREAYILKKMVSNPAFKDSMQKMLTYRSLDGTRTWLFEYFDSKNVQRNVYLKQYSDKGVLLWDVNAKEAEYDPVKGWEFRGLTLTTYKRLKLTSEFDSGSEASADTLAPVAKSMPSFVRPPDEFQETPEDILNSSRSTDEMSSAKIIGILRQADDMSQASANVYKTILVSRMTFPWVCLLSVFLGVPLAARNLRRGVMVAVVMAVAVIIAYTFFSHVFVILGKRGILPPLVAGGLPTGALVAYVWWNLTRHNV